MIDTKIQLNFEIEKDEYYCEQRARLNWLKLGDRNTTYFHSQATQRRRRNQIIKLQNEQGKDTEDVKEIEGIARAYFQNLFTVGNTVVYEQLIMGFNCCVYEEDNRKLIAPYTGEEVREALFGMGSTKALGEDRFPALFCKKCWNIIGEDFSFCLSLLNGYMEVSQINSKYIVLIPNITNPFQFDTFSTHQLMQFCL